jgi:hypothetical protein
MPTETIKTPTRTETRRDFEDKILNRAIERGQQKRREEEMGIKECQIVLNRVDETNWAGIDPLQFAKNLWRNSSSKGTKRY